MTVPKPNGFPVPSYLSASGRTAGSACNMSLSVERGCQPFARIACKVECHHVTIDWKAEGFDFFWREISAYSDRNRLVDTEEYDGSEARSENGI